MTTLLDARSAQKASRLHTLNLSDQPDGYRLHEVLACFRGGEGGEWEIQVEEKVGGLFPKDRRAVNRRR